MHTKKKKDLLVEDFQIFLYTIPIQYKYIEEVSHRGTLTRVITGSQQLPHRMSLANIYIYSSVK